ncbi:MAG: hypothetical protein RLZZ142_2628 [Verrucomicrobiota bacterium]|jgi:uncharacterized protein (DUF111 family)
METLPQGFEVDRLLQVETNLDDATPETIGYVCERLREAGALDVWTAPIQMKKNRPAVLLALLCDPSQLAVCSEILFRESGAFGLRFHEVTRLKLRRDFVEVPTPHGTVTIKRGFQGDQLLQSVPEYEACKALARQSGVPLREIFEAAKQAAQTVSPCHRAP